MRFGFFFWPYTPEYTIRMARLGEDLGEQVRAARKAGVPQLMFTVSLAADPVRTIELFGRHVLPAVVA